MNRFASIRSSAPPQKSEGVKAVKASSPAAKAPGRAGKKAVSGYFTPDVSRGLHQLALERDTNLQALMGEAFDDLMRKYGKHPFGER